MKWNQSNMNRARDDVHMGVPVPLLVFLRVVALVSIRVRPDWEQVHVLAETSRWIKEAPNIQYSGDVNRFLRRERISRPFYIRQRGNRVTHCIPPSYYQCFNNVQHVPARENRITLLHVKRSLLPFHIFFFSTGNLRKLYQLSR